MLKAGVIEIYGQKSGEPEQQAAQGRFQIARYFYLIIEKIFGHIQCFGEDNRYYPGETSQQDIKRNLPGGNQFVGRNDKGRSVVQESPGNHRRQHR